jgi:hypothetical protein
MTKECRNLNDEGSIGCEKCEILGRSMAESCCQYVSYEFHSNSHSFSGSSPSALLARQDGPLYMPAVLRELPDFLPGGATAFGFF